MMRLLTVLVVALGVSGCALTEDVVDISFSPTPAATERAGAKDILVKVIPNDRRIAYQDRVSSKKNGYGMEMAAIKPSRPVPEIVRTALETGLAAQGYQVHVDGRDILVDVVKLYSNYQVGFFSADAQGEIILHLSVPGTEFSRTYPANFTEPNIVIMGGAGAQAALNGALAHIVSTIMADEQFHAALAKRAAIASTTPAS